MGALLCMRNKEAPLEKGAVLLFPAVLEGIPTGEIQGLLLETSPLPAEGC